MLSFDFGWNGDWYTIELTTEWIIGLSIAVWFIIGMFISKLLIPDKYRDDDVIFALFCGMFWPISAVILIISGIFIGFCYLLTFGKEHR